MSLPRPPKVVVMFTLALGVLALSGCDTYTCEGACSQYYGEDGCYRPSILSDGTSSEEASRNCVSDCRDALYTTTESPGGADDRNYRVLENQTDAEEFINCVAEQDYSAEVFAATCEDLQHRCSWFRW